MYLKLLFSCQNKNFLLAWLIYLSSQILFKILQEKKLERHCRSATTCNALYVTLLGKTIAR